MNGNYKMNPQIRKLALEADAYCDTHWLGSPFYNLRWEEKFAELIIKECALTVQDFVDHRFPASEYPNRLNRYFGVE